MMVHGTVCWWWPYLRHGDLVRIEMQDAVGLSIFGSIEQRVTP